MCPAIIMLVHEYSFGWTVLESIRTTYYAKSVYVFVHLPTSTEILAHELV